MVSDWWVSPGAPCYYFINLRKYHARLLFLARADPSTETPKNPKTFLVAGDTPTAFAIVRTEIGVWFWSPAVLAAVH